jgi:hypothetical protein
MESVAFLPFMNNAIALGHGHQPSHPLDDVLRSLCCALEVLMIYALFLKNRGTDVIDTN